jgi:hypothetical protein
MIPMRKIEKQAHLREKMASSDISPELIDFDNFPNNNSEPQDEYSRE